MADLIKLMESIRQPQNRLMGADWMAQQAFNQPYKTRVMEHQNYIGPYQQFEQEYPGIAQYGQDVLAGRIAMGDSPYSIGGGLKGLSQTLQAAQEGDPTNMLEYVGPGAVATPLFRAMTAFHGSPHKFDQFKLDKIGTGEGAQAYGHGLYFAESPGVAKSYQARLSSNAGEYIPGYYSGAKEIEGTPQVRAVASYLDDNRTIIEAKDIAKRMHPDIDPSLIDSVPSDLYAGNKAGHLYEVDIPDQYIDNFLDWDEPLSEQPESVKQAFMDSSGSFGRLEGKIGKDAYYDLTANAGGQKQASDILNSLGIKGIKYLDQASRGSGEGTRNLVVFDDSIVKTLKRNEKPID